MINVEILVFFIDIINMYLVEDFYYMISKDWKFKYLSIGNVYEGMLVLFSYLYIVLVIIFKLNW